MHEESPDTVHEPMVDPAAEPAPVRRLDCAIEVVRSDRVNFAMQQNGVPLVDEVRLVAGGAAPIENATLTLALENDEAEPFTVRLARLEPGVPAVVHPEGFTLSGKKLATRTEAERTAILATVRVAGEAVGADDAEARASFAVDLLAFDQWPGVGHAPELTAAFVTPNHPRIGVLLGGARESLQRRGVSDALDGYQAGSRSRAADLAEACFHALSAMEVGYINPPASFETAGQRVRLVDRVARERLGTCLDLSLVLMGMWEQCGLHPLLLLTEGHALPALWTHEAHLPEVAIDEPARLRNLIELGEIVPVESTLVTQRGGSFKEAVAAGKKRMDAPGGFFCAIDVRSARKRGIRPLPLREGAGDDAASEVDVSSLGVVGSVASAGSTLDRVALADRAERRVRPGGIPGIDEEIETPNERIGRWQRRLLDLSLRNRLLNFRDSARTVGIVGGELAAIEDRLADGKRLTLLARPEDPKPLDDPEFLRESLGARQLYLSETPADSQKRLLTLFRTAKSSIEETGANLLYLAMGLLKWYETPSSDEARFAPLILLPITLHRSAAGSGYSYAISLSDEPLRPNVTLLEKLRVEFGIDTAGLDDLPEDESGLDVPMILRNFRAAIRDTSRWEVIETARIGLFSFNKFLMWRDLQDNLKKLKSNRLVSHLVERPGSDFDPTPFPSADRLDDEVKPDDMLCTRDADSSQLAAIRAAAEGRSFVLEGPPGTGKSQTIANMIADALAHGRRVLFVAEKMAALSVVRKRLEDDGLGAFCLELHSAKASKKEVLAQLQQSLDAGGSGEPPEWASLCRDLSSTRDELNRYVRAMHLPRASGESLYRVLGRLCLLGDGARVSPPVDDPSGVEADRLGDWRGHVETLAARSQPIDPSHEHPLRGIGQSNWSFTLTDEARGTIDGALAALGRLRTAAEAFLQAIGGGVLAPGLSHDAVKRLAAASSQLQQCPGVSAALLVGSEAAARRDAVMALGKQGRKRDALREELLARYREEFLELDHLPHIDAVRRLIEQPAMVRWFTAGGVKRSLRVYAKQGLPGWAELLADLERAREHKRMTAEIGIRADVAALLGSRWKSGRPDWNEIDALLAWCEPFAMTLAGLAGDRSALGLAEALARIAGDAEANERAKPVGRSLIEAWNGWVESWASACRSLASSNELAFGESGQAGEWLVRADETLRRWRGALGELNPWCTWRHARDAAVEAGLGELVALYERGGCGREALGEIFERSYGHAWFNAIANAEPAVRGFNAEAHADTIERFRRIDHRAIELSRHIITARLNGAMPATPEQASAQSEIGILRRELRKRSRHIPTRKLIEAMPTLLPRLKPCFLMSPLSVAQFLDAKLPAFDLVVFDEASQIPVWDAVGAIARGTEVIVVGDSKQLPPTNFFNIIGNEEDGDAEDIGVEDMESILEECNASGVPGLRLRWHYRSRHETLIAFSNHHYYDNELHTFPSPEEQSERLGVSLVHVADGVYDRGGSRTNRVEAQRVVDHVIGMLRDPDDHDSIGIVTFNQAQQGLIEDLLDAKRREMPEIEPYFTGESHEPVFIKNLENVQGDERDTIIFSVGYGKDQAGKASMNFGPLNKDGGERRLNVAVTRARRRLMVFASITSDQIDLNRTRATGVRHFKTFLDYAQRGPRALVDAVLFSNTRDFDSPFERAVCQALGERGWQVDQQVGCAGYRIDLAVRHPEKPGRYVLGIECDGAAYHSARTARDRDRLRQSVLEGLGWTIERVWSTEWWVNPQRCLDKLEHAIREALLAPERGVAIERRPPAEAAKPEHADDPGEAEPAHAESTNKPFASNAASIDTPSPVTSTEPPSGPAVYRLAVFSKAKRLAGLDPADPSAAEHAKRAIEELVRDEAPIVEALAMRRLADAFGVSRLTERVREALEGHLEACEHAGVLRRVDGVLWAGDAAPPEYQRFRVPNDADDSTRRDIEEIPLIELSNAVAQTLREQFGMPREELAREVGKRFGAQRITARIGERLDKAIEHAIERGQAIADNSGSVLPPMR